MRLRTHGEGNGGWKTSEREGRMMRRRSKRCLLAVVGLTSMIPGSVGPEMAAVDVPIFLGLGDRDIAGEPHGIPAFFTGSHDISLFVLPGTGHNHNVAPAREQLWDRLATWALQF